MLLTNPARTLQPNNEKQMNRLINIMDSNNKESQYLQNEKINNDFIRTIKYDYQ